MRSLRLCVTSATVAAMITAPACSLLTDTDGLAGTADGARDARDAEVDAASDVDADATRPALQDAGDTSRPVDDGGSPLDAGPDAPFCARSDASFCTSFDETPPPALWGFDDRYQSPSGGSILELAVDRFTSSPASLLAHTAAIDGGTTFVTLAKRIPLPVEGLGSAELRFSLRIEAPHPTSPVDLVALDVGPADPRGRYTLSVQSAGGKLVLHQATPAVNGPEREVADKPAVTLAAERWVSVALRLDRTNARATLRVDGVTTDDALLGPVPAGAVFAMVGVAYAYGPVGRVRLHYDDVTLNIR